jgi:uncharacterized protein YcfJ
MSKKFAVSILGSSLAALAAFTATPASAMDILARVISSTPVVQQVAVPRQVCNNQQYITEAPRSGGGAVLGALAGGAAGNAIGDGGGRALATMIGLVGGAIVGDRIEGGGRQEVQNVQQCTTQTAYENRPSHYNVVYEYQGTQYSTQMANDPGLYVRLQVTPVGGAAPVQQGQSATQPAPQAYQQPQPTYQNEPVPQPGYVVQSPQPIVGQTMITSGTTYYPAAPVYYGNPYYASPAYYGPAVAPIGLSLNFGYSRGWAGGHRHGGHWR